MPFGTFLDSMPAILFISVHVIFLLVGLWVSKTAMDKKLAFAQAFWLYVLTQIVFLSFFGGIITFKMAVLLDQTLVFVMVLWIISKTQRQA